MSTPSTPETSEYLTYATTVTPVGSQPSALYPASLLTPPHLPPRIILRRRSRTAPRHRKLSIRVTLPYHAPIGLPFQILVLKRRSRRQANRHSPQWIVAHIPTRRQWHRIRNRPTPQLRDRSGDEDILPVHGCLELVERHGYR